MTRIAHVTATYPPYWSGAGAVAWYSARELARRGHVVEVLTSDAGGETLAPDGVRVRRLPALFRLGNAPLLPELPRALRGFDVIHLHYPFILGAELVALAGALSHTPFVITYHNDTIAGGVRGALFKGYERSVGRWALRRAAVILAVTRDHWTHSRARRLLGDRCPPVQEVPNGVDSGLFRPARDEGAALRREVGVAADLPLVAVVGTLDAAHHYRRLDVLLRAVAAASADCACGLLVAGGGPRTPAYQRAAAELGIGDRVWFLGAVGHTRLRAVYNAAALLALPSERQESFGMVLIEALACGIPVIASDLPGAREVVATTGGGVVVPPGDDAALATSLAALLRDGPRREALGNAGRRVVAERYTWEVIGDSLESLYRDAIGARGTRAA
jgi:glycosyltransferase involved in cell wall biosynthesis